MDLQNRLSFLDVRHGDHHLSVKAAGPQKGGVQHVGPVGGGEDYNPVLGIKAVHFN